jgi:ABC-type nitrate/sulfonate/bicarbonate transport system ATPase subunit
VDRDVGLAGGALDVDAMVVAARGATLVFAASPNNPTGGLLAAHELQRFVTQIDGQALLVLDEIFGSLDETRRLGVLSLLRAIEVRFPQVVIITHIESVRETADRVLRVRYDEASGSATVAEERVPDDAGGQGAVVAA